MTKNALALIMVCVLLVGCQQFTKPGGETSEAPGSSSAPAESPAPAESSAPVDLPGQDRTRDLADVPEVAPEGFRSPPPGKGMARYRDQQVRWQPCDEGTECAEVAMPLDHDQPNGQAITIAIRRTATEGEARGTVFINPGGPGGSGWEMVGGFLGGLYGYDVAGFDPRGVGRSTPVHCADGERLDEFHALDVTPDDPGEREELLRQTREFTESCLAKSGRLLEHISTEDTVKDLDLLRHLVGDEKLHYLGYSYGTAIGALYAELYGDNVGHLVLDSAVNIAEDEEVVQAQGFDRSLRNFAAWCADEDCGLGAKADEVVAAIDDLWASVDDQPLSVGDRELTQSLAVLGTLTPLYQDESGWPSLADALLQAIDGDGKALLEFADSYNERNEEGEYGQLAFGFHAIRCLDTPDAGLADAAEDYQQAKQKAPLFGANSGADLICPLWPVAPAVNKELRITGDKVDVPILVIGTTGDSATPYEYAKTMADQLKTGVLLTLDGEGHGAFASGHRCIDYAVEEYFIDGVAPPKGTTCT